MERKPDCDGFCPSGDKLAAEGVLHRGSAAFNSGMGAPDAPHACEFPACAPDTTLPLENGLSMNKPCRGMEGHILEEAARKGLCCN